MNIGIQELITIWKFIHFNLLNKPTKIRFSKTIEAFTDNNVVFNSTFSPIPIILFLFISIAPDI